MWLADVTAAWACRATNTPHVAYLVDRRSWLTSNTWKHRFRRTLTRSAFSRAGTKLLAVSDAVAQFFAANIPVDRRLIEVVRNSVVTRRFSEIATERRDSPPRCPLIVGMLSRLVEEKGHRSFLDAVEELVRRNAKMHVRIAGEGPLRAELEQRVARPEFAGRVRFLGPVAEVREFYRQVDVFVVPSIHSEGLPTTILEAMASGCTVVATDVGGACEAIRDNVDGLLVPPGEPTPLADALETIIGNAGLRATLSGSAVDRVTDEFDVESMLDRIVGVYGRLLDSRDSPHCVVEPELQC